MLSPIVWPHIREGKAGTKSKEVNFHFCTRSIELKDWGEYTYNIVYILDPRPVKMQNKYLDRNMSGKRKPTIAYITM